MTMWHMSDNQVLRRLPAFLPAGRPLGADAFAKRHQGLLVLLWLHVPALVAFALARGFAVGHSMSEGAIVATFAVVATLASGQRVRSVAVALGLVMSSAVLVHLWDGAIEGHFHFFVVMTALALYQSWLPFLAALGFVVLEHGVLGALAASSVYNHAAGTQHPWRWALIHGGFVLASCVGNLLAWRLTEDEALHDALTGLANRTLFLDCLEARLRGRHVRTAVLFLDVDSFKDANDGFGHELGDALLVAVAGRLSARLRTGDLVARLGGDEFAVLLTAQSEACAQATADRLLTAFDEPFALGDLSIATSVSAGLATARPGSTPVSLLRDADLAMYASKRAGGGRCTTFTADMHDAATRRSALISDLPRALRDGEFVVHYQPVFGLADDAIVGVEALVRWLHPARGLVPPGDFIEAAEQSGFIVELGKHVLRVACAQAVAWREMFPDHPELVMSVNLSPRQLAEPDLVSTVADVLAQTTLVPGSLCLEVTETAVIRDLGESVPRLRALSAVGIRLALDDFGTGYSSLAYLQQMPVDALKVDRSFVAALGEDKPGTAIVRAVVELAHQLGLAVTAEGIETPDQLEILRSLRCETGQGYLRARPATAEDVTELLCAERGRGLPAAARDSTSAA
jgi:diguanylate cyclase (GGDEF)-like protein